MNLFYKKLFFLVISVCFLNTTYGQNSMPIIDQNSNLLNRDLNSFKWINKPESFELKEHSLIIEAGENTDFFNNPVSKKISDNAPFFYTEVSGDFVMKTLIRPDLSKVWNACGLMVYIDGLNWIKYEFENSDATGNSIVSVITKGDSDDANGAILHNREYIWLKVVRKGNVYSMHWSTDDVKYKMTRLVSLESSSTVKVGMQAQCPADKPKKHEFLYFSLDPISVKDMRVGK